MSVSRDARVLLVVPTLGHRLALLRQTLSSIADQDSPARVVIVAPLSEALVAIAGAFDAELVPDPGSLAGAINLGARHGLGEQDPPSHEFVNWLNDDDLLEPGSLSTTMSLLDEHPSAVVAFGACRYIDPDGRQLWVSRAGAWAPRVLSWGPDLIPQPGMLVRATAWRSVGGLDESYRLAFDLDLLLRLRRLGPFVHTTRILSSFRWHATSLTVHDRDTNLRESERAKRSSLGPIGRALSRAWNPPVRVAIRLAANRVQRRALRLAAQ